ncbi:hypothetical protein RBQ61_02795 [Sedimentibacter sp. MB35-C1]|uniref:hypothetical protein n=1 Tax=Sedimentibacter sp. MB35-C1 TaxID=3070995 RepID=UPI0027E16CD7|nr:hypothetical protein [Sedimentibacter sp. MB35-C1]WMJ77873.1 hypothetical protein RBQ61_02795 [Sedimentibacter sp. MB35-C1]
MYKIILIAVLICAALIYTKRLKKMKLKNSVQQNKISVLTSKLDKIIFKNVHLSQAKESYVIKLRMINLKSDEENNELILKFLLYSITATILLFALLSTVITMWYATITISFVFFYLIMFFGIAYVKIKINKIHGQFSVALQRFIDKYIISKNIKNAINNSYPRMPKEIGAAFEMLTRELSGAKNPEIPIKKFASELSYVWGHNFVEILLLSYKGVGDITDDLLRLNSIVLEEITTEEEDKSSRYANKMTFIIVYTFALIGIIVNLFINDMARHLYFYTATGNKLLAIWLMVLIAGITVISISERGGR